MIAQEKLQREREYRMRYDLHNYMDTSEIAGKYRIFMGHSWMLNGTGFVVRNYRAKMFLHMYPGMVMFDTMGSEEVVPLCFYLRKTPSKYFIGAVVNWFCSLRKCPKHFKFERRSQNERKRFDKI